MIIGAVAQQSVRLAAPSYPEAGDVVLQAHFAGADASTSADDESFSGHALTFNNNAQILSNKLELDGTNDFISLPHVDDWDFSDGDFCVEFFGVEFDTTSGSRTLMSATNAYSGSTDRAWIFTHISGSGLTYNFSTNGSNSNVQDMGFECVTGVEYYICFERVNGVLRCYVGEDGGAAEMVYKEANTLSIRNVNSAPRIGVRRSSGAEIDDFDGRIEGIRIINGGGPYANDAGFAPPTLPFDAPYALRELTTIFSTVGNGDVWRFDSENTDADALDDPIRTATGLVNGLELAEADPSHVPLLKEVDGRQCALFDGAADRLLHSFGSTLTQPGTIIIALKNNDTSTHLIVTGSASGSRWQISNDSSDNLISVASSALDSGTNLPIDKAVLTATYDGASSVFRIDGVQTATGNPGTNGTNRLTIGALWDGSFGGNFHAFGVLLADRLLTSDELDYCEWALAAWAAESL